MAHTDRRATEQLPRYDCLIFDLDDTLYPLSSGLALSCTKNIGDYVHEKLGVEKSEVVDLCTKLYKAHGTTMAGLRVAGFDFDYDDYHRFVHGRLPYETLRPDPVLRNLLLSMPQRKIVFTNGDKVHATKVLNRLGLQDCFEGIICFETLNPLPEAGQPKPLIVCKPALEAFDLALQLANADPSRSIFFDDSVRNIAAAKRAGLHTVLVGNTVKTEGADHTLGSLHNMREALPEIWVEECAESSRKAVRTRRSLSMETVVNA